MSNFPPPSEKQLEYAKSIAISLDLDIENEPMKQIFSNGSLTSQFITRFKDEAMKKNKEINNTKLEHILKELNFLEFLELLGYEKVKDKYCITYPVMEHPQTKDRVTLRIEYNKEKNLQYYVHFLPKQPNTVEQFEFKNIQKSNTQRALRLNPSGVVAGGNVIDFILQRTLNYSKIDIINMLSEIATDKSKSINYELNYDAIKNKKYSIPTATELEEDSYKAWSLDYSNFKQKSNGAYSDFTFRAIDYQDVKALDTKKSLICSAYKSKRTDKPVLFSFSVPSYKIYEEDGAFKVKIIGDQIINVASNKIYNAALDIINDLKIQRHTNVSPRFDPEELEAKAYKLSKIKLPDELKNNLGYFALECILSVKNEYGFYKLINDNKLMRKNSKRGLSIINFPKNREQDDTIGVITENPFLDGISAIKLGYFDKDKTILMGTLGNPSSEFYANLKQFMNVFSFKKIVIATDNDAAGEKFYEDISIKIEEIAKSLFNEKIQKITGEYEKNFLENIKDMSDLHRYAKIISAQNLTSKFDRIFFENLSNFTVDRLVPKQGKDFNEELIIQATTKLDNNVEKVAITNKGIIK